MKKHILSSISEVKNQKTVPKTYYDMKTQVSYTDKDFKKSVTQIRGERSVETRVIETSDEDNFNVLGRTKSTFTVENSDSDEINMYQSNNRTNLSETVENSDEDGFDFYVLNEISKATNNIESSDPDEFYLSSSIHTATIEVSDPDEFIMS